MHGASDVGPFRARLKAAERPSPAQASWPEEGRNARCRDLVAQVSKPAVSPISNWQKIRFPGCVWHIARPAGWKPAIRQVRNLRYFKGATNLRHQRLAFLFLRRTAALQNLADEQ